jgi:hypothetical protein
MPKLSLLSPSFDIFVLSFLDTKGQHEIETCGEYGICGEYRI